MAKTEISEYNHTTVLRDAHNEEQHALDIITANNLVPSRYGKVLFTYITSGNGEGEVGEINFLSEGEYQTTKIIPLADQLGSAHKTTVYFIQRTPAMLAGKAFIIYDNSGAVVVWFNVDSMNTAPIVPEASRYIEVSLLSTDTHEDIAQKTSTTVHADSQFLSVYSPYFIIISSSTTGIKPNSKDHNSSLGIKNVLGSNYISLNNKYFYINSALNSTLYYVWYNVAGTGTDPNISGRTGIMVALPSGASQSIVSENTKIALDATSQFITNIEEGSLLVKNKYIGITNETTDVNTGFLVLTEKSGKSRETVATIILEYDVDCNVTSVERI